MLTKVVECPFCLSHPGKNRAYKSETCIKCGGIAQISIDANKTKKCPFCKGDGGRPNYSIELCPVCNGDGLVKDLENNYETISLLGIVSGQKYEADKSLKELFKELRGDIKIVDPYLGDESLSRLLYLENVTSVDFVTKNTSNLNLALFNSFKSENNNFNFKKSTSNTIHDRYIISDDKIMLLGHGIKDIGKRDSFIISIDNSIAQELINETKLRFHQLWSSATSI